jgi:transposase
MAKRQFQLNEKEVEQFRQAEQQTRDVHELKRLQAVRLYGTGMSIGQIMDIYNCGASSIREWVQKYSKPVCRLCARIGARRTPAN